MVDEDVGRTTYVRSATAYEWGPASFMNNEVYFSSSEKEGVMKAEVRLAYPKDAAPVERFFWDGLYASKLPNELKHQMRLRTTTTRESRATSARFEIVYPGYSLDAGLRNTMVGLALEMHAFMKREMIATDATSAKRH